MNDRKRLRSFTVIYAYGELSMMITRLLAPAPAIAYHGILSEASIENFPPSYFPAAELAAKGIPCPAAAIGLLLIQMIWSDMFAMRMSLRPFICVSILMDLVLPTYWIVISTSPAVSG